ncbi:MAG: glycosyltransferase family 39 protein, partial [Bdellovibrionales bacterium]|nr:glycosyltransferase family 39 protein [Bdellovibrionales bacterium]
WEWANRLDLAYYSKGPVVALLIAASTAVFGDSEFAIRLPGLLCGLFLSLLMWFVLRRLAERWIALLVWLLFRSTLFFFTLGLVITTDPPAMLLWFAVVACGLRAVRFDAPWWWLPAGVLAGVAVLTKYTALILPASVGFFLLCESSRRRHLRSPGFISGVLAGALLLVPVVVWNARHHWVNVLHNSGHLVQSEHPAIHLRFFPELLGAQIGLIGPALCVLLYLAAWAGFKRWRRYGDIASGYLVLSAMPLAVVCVLVSLTKRVYANWPMPLFLGLFPLLALLLAHLWQSRNEFWQPRLVRWSFGLNVVIVLFSLGPILGITYGLPAERLPTKKLVGWREVGAAVDRLSAEFPNGSRPFLVNDRYGTLSAIRYYSSTRPDVMCSAIGDRRMNQYDIWQSDADFLGRNALIVTNKEGMIEDYRRAFDEIQEISEPLPIIYSSEVLRTFYFYKGTNYRGGLTTTPTHH